MTFPQALFGNGKTAGVDKHGKKNLLPAPAAMPAPVMPEKVEPSKTVAVVETPKPAPVAKAVAMAAAAEDKPVAAKPEPKAEAKIAEPTGEPKAALSARAKVAELKEAKPAPAAKPASIPTVAAGDTKGKGRFALQLSSFQDKSEAEAFAQKFDGERPYLVVSEIPGKGTWYRVRVGDFASSKDAAVGKASFEKKHNVIAYVAQK